MGKIKKLGFMLDKIVYNNLVRVLKLFESKL